MLPMFTHLREVESFFNYVNGKTKTCLLLETSKAYLNIDEILKVNEIEEIHIGLNDLHIDMRLNFMFELLINGVVDTLMKERNIPKAIKFVQDVCYQMVDEAFDLKSHLMEFLSIDAFDLDEFLENVLFIEHHRIIREADPRLEICFLVAVDNRVRLHIPRIRRTGHS